MTAPTQETVRALTDRERAAIAPEVQQMLEASEQVRKAKDRLERMLQLMEPDPAIKFSLERMEFYRDVPATSDPPARRRRSRATKRTKQR